MKVKDTFAYCSAKVPMLVTEGVGKVLFDGDRNEMPEELEELTATRFEFLFNERKFWVAVEAQKSKEEKQSPAEAGEKPYEQNCANCAFLDQQTFVCRIKRKFIRNPTQAICCVYGKHNGTMDESDYEYQIVARRAFLDPSRITEDSNVACADCAFYHKKKCFMGAHKIKENTVCGFGKKRSDYE